MVKIRLLLSGIVTGVEASRPVGVTRRQGDRCGTDRELKHVTMTHGGPAFTHSMSAYSGHFFCKDIKVLRVGLPWKNSLFREPVL